MLNFTDLRRDGEGKKAQAFHREDILPGHSHDSLMLYAGRSGSSNYVLAHSTPQIAPKKNTSPSFEAGKAAFLHLI